MSIIEKSRVNVVMPKIVLLSFLIVMSKSLICPFFKKRKNKTAGVIKLRVASDGPRIITCDWFKPVWVRAKKSKIGDRIGKSIRCEIM